MSVVCWNESTKTKSYMHSICVCVCVCVCIYSECMQKHRQLREGRMCTHDENNEHEKKGA